jgi:hypothetical protein
MCRFFPVMLFFYFPNSCNISIHDKHNSILTFCGQSRETWNPPAPAGGGMRRNSRYYREPPAPAGGGSTI